jgi:retinol dehydrogenase 12
VQNQPNLFAAMNDRSFYVQRERYADTKTLDVFLTEVLAKNPLLNDVVVCSVNPGFCRSELMREFPTIFRT